MVRTQECSEQFLEFPGRNIKPTNNCTAINLPKITDTLMIRRLRFIGQCWRKKDEVISDHVE